MRGYKNRTHNKRNQRPAIISRWFSGYWVSAVDRKRKFLVTDDIRNHDWRSWSDQFDLALTWYGYKLAITIASLTAFFTGIGQILFKLARH